MKKKLYLLTTIIATGAVLLFSSCLKDNSHYVNFNTGQTLVDFPLGGVLNFASEAITATADSNGNVTTTIGLNVASANVPTNATTIQLVEGSASDVSTINNLEKPVNYLVVPTADYTAPTSVTIPAGQQYAKFTVTIKKGNLDPSLSYVLPIRITSGTSASLTSNLNVYYIHIIGNPFAGLYKQNFERWNAPDSTSAALNGNSFFGQSVIAFPVSPTEFTIKSGYAGSLVSYDVNFTSNPDGTFTNFTVQLLPSDIAVLTANSISVVQPPVFDPALPSTQPNYTKAQALKLFRFQWIAKTSSDRYLVDTYVKQ